MTAQTPCNSSNMSSLANQVALITGASQGIGDAIARKLAGLGVHLMLCARNEEKLTQLATQLRAKYPSLSIHVIRCDVRDSTQVQHAVDETLKHFSRLDILINNAGIAPKSGLLQELSFEEIARTIETNLTGAIYCMKAVLPPMVQQQSGTIININSIAGKTAYPYWAAYDASKFGLHAVTEAVADEQRRNNIKVMGIYPGAVDTPIWEGISLDEAPRREGMLSPEQVADAVVYSLCQPKNVFVTDITITPLQPAV